MAFLVSGQWVSYEEEVIDLFNCGLKKVPPELASCEECVQLDLSVNKIEKLEHLPPNLKILLISSNRIRSLEGLPASLHTLIIYWNRVERLEGLPAGLRKLDLAWNRLEELGELPQGLEWLDVTENRLKELRGLPERLHTLYASWNKISAASLPLSLRTLNLSYNPIILTKDLLPRYLTTLIAYNCKMPQVLQELLEQINSGEWARDNWEKDRRRIILDFLSAAFYKN